MAEISIKFYEFALLVHSPSRLTVLFPETDHTLLLTHDDKTLRTQRTLPVKRGATLDIRTAAGTPLPAGAPTLTADYGKYMADVSKVEGRPFSVPPALINPAQPANPAVLNAKLHLTGGTLTAMPCSIAAFASAPWIFATGEHLVTDTAQFTVPVPDGETYTLFVNGKSTLSLRAGDSLLFRNMDVLGGSGAEFIDLEEYERLLKVIDPAYNATAPKNTVLTEGIDNVCAILSVYEVP